MERRIITINLIVCSALLFLLNGCEDTGPKIYNESKAFVILENAKEISCTLRDDGSILLSYKLKENYPASSFLKAVSTQLESAGWHALKEDFLNPNQLSSHVEGWQNFINPLKEPVNIGYSWIGSWEDKHENIITYILIYQYPKNKKENLSVLLINEIYVPATEVRLFREKAKR